MKMLMRGVLTLVLLGPLAVVAGLPIEGGNNKTKSIDVPDPTVGGTGNANQNREKGPYDDVLRFKDSDTLHGNLVSIAENGLLTWVRPDVQSPIKIKLDNIRGIRLSRAGAKSPTGTRVALTNDDVLYGQLVSLNSEDLVLDTWFGGQLTIPRVMVRTIKPGNESSEVVLNGLGKLSDWTFKGGKWRFSSSKASCSNGQLGRNLKLGERIHVELTVEWNGNYPDFNIVTYTNDLRPYPQDCYNLQVNGSYIYLYQGSHNENLGNFPYHKLRNMRKVKVDLFIDKNEKSVALMFDGELVKQWAGLNYVPSGSGFMLASQGNYGRTTFSRLRVTTWDGKLKTGVSANSSATQDIVHFANGDKMSGTVKTIETGQIQLQTAYQPLKVPVSNVTSIAFREDEAERARRNLGDVNLYFPNGDFITMKLLKLENGKIKGKSENFGVKEFDLSTFIGVRFNIYDEVDEDEVTDFDDLIFGD